jgi:hypothetical protein
MLAISRRLVGLSVLAFGLSVGAADASGILLAARDTEDFSGSLPDALAQTTTTGALAGLTTLISTTYQVNGIGDGGGFLFAGSAVNDDFLKIGYDGSFISATTTGTGYRNFCCNEDIAYDPATNTVYRALYSDRIVAVSPTDGSLITSYLQPDAVGMAYVNGELWISKWNGREVGTWDPATNTYTKKFDTDGAGGINGNAGGLAFDPFDNILWIGFSGGVVAPWSLTGTLLNGGFQPFGAMSETVDGLVFLGEASSSPVPEPSSLVLLGAGLAALAARRRRRVRT